MEAEDRHKLSTKAKKVEGEKGKRENAAKDDRRWKQRTAIDEAQKQRK